jgi:hypothetical protein
MNARPAQHFALPPYRAELFSERSGWAGVMNRNGFNCLTFPDKPGAVVTDYETAKRIADDWNGANAIT